MFKVTEDIIYVGVNDHEVDLFEGQYDVPNGMAYNSYVVLDEKVAVFDTVDAHFKDEWLANLEEAFEGRTPDYLIVQHMEPDHAANIANFAEKYPEAKIVGNAKTFPMMKQFFGTDFADRQVIVKEGETLSTGKHNLTFVMAPMVHWPEVMMTYDTTDKIFFSADAFGKFGALDVEEEWDCEARRYYIGIVGKYGPMGSYDDRGQLQRADELAVRSDDIKKVHALTCTSAFRYSVEFHQLISKLYLLAEVAA